MGTAVTAAQDVAWDGQHVAALLERAARRNERTALFAGLDHDHRARQSADDPIPQRKEPLLRRCARHELADDGALLLDLTRDRPPFGLIQHVDAPAVDRHGRAASQRATMRPGIDAARE